MCKIAIPSHLAQAASDAGGYVTVFDVTRSGYRQWSFAAFGLTFVAVGLAIPTLIRLGIFRKQPPWMEKWFPRVFLGFAIFWTATSFLATYTEYRGAVHAMRSQQAHFVEGTVSQFIPMPYTGHAMESFVVQGVRFEYSDYAITAGFNNTASHGGPIREGLPVRIWYRGNEILRLDVAKRPNQSTQLEPTALDEKIFEIKSRTFAQFSLDFFSMRKLYVYETPAGAFYIAEHNGQFHPLFQEQSLGNDATAQEAADAGRWPHFSLPGGIDRSDLWRSRRIKRLGEDRA